MQGWRFPGETRQRIDQVWQIDPIYMPTVSVCLPLVYSPGSDRKKGRTRLSLTRAHHSIFGYPLLPKKRVEGPWSHHTAPSSIGATTDCICILLTETIYLFRAYITRRRLGRYHWSRSRHGTPHIHQRRGSRSRHGFDGCRSRCRHGCSAAAAAATNGAGAGRCPGDAGYRHGVRLQPLHG